MRYFIADSHIHTWHVYVHIGNVINIIITTMSSHLQWYAETFIKQSKSNEQNATKLLQEIWFGLHL